ncbi:PREDICTED: membrane cofactor protein-like [Myotis davidii]|uniref:membrane cofactor protein-like n=1 Tax=Myotis davidii TaxID=225400 RepID=UPI000767B540|nr:PREDICTED: membrane cofactor protein-like [Myotis davidii]
MKIWSLVQKLSIVVMRVTIYMEQKFYIVNFLETMWNGVMLHHIVKRFGVNHLNKYQMGDSPTATRIYLNIMKKLFIVAILQRDQTNIPLLERAGLFVLGLTNGVVTRLSVKSFPLILEFLHFSVVTCEYPALENGRLVSTLEKGKFQYKSEVTFQCKEGFYLEGSRTIVCGADSTWEPKIPKCTEDGGLIAVIVLAVGKGSLKVKRCLSAVALDSRLRTTTDLRSVSAELQVLLLLGRDAYACDDPPRYQSMKIKGNPKASYNAGDTIEYECRLGYKRIVPVLPMSTVCQPSNTWVPPLQEACTKKACQNLGDLVNGDVVYANGSMEFGSQAHFKCNAGYYLLGPKIIYCELSGNNVEWSDNLPHCEKVLCKPPPKIPNGEFTNSHKVSFEYNEIVTYRCKPSGGPDEYSLVGESRLVCIGQDQWSSNPPECKVVKCTFPNVPNGRVVSGFGKKYLYKAEVKFECLAGFYLEGSSTIVCGADNTWKPKIPTCIKGAKGSFCLFCLDFISLTLNSNDME